MNFEELTALVGDNEKAKNFIKGVEETVNTNVQTINKNETLINNLKGDLEKFKQGNSLVKNTLGLEQLNEDSLKEAINSLKKGNPDEKTQNEIKQLQDMLKQKNNEVESLNNKFTQYQRDMNSKDMVKKYATHESVVPTARVDVENRINAMMSYDENNKPIFLNEDGTTKYIDGKAADFEAVFNEIKSNSPHLFVGTTASGGGTQGNQSNNNATVGKIDGTKEEQEAYIRQKFNK